jgi:hypothetical protein
MPFADPFSPFADPFSPFADPFFPFADPFSPFADPFSPFADPFSPFADPFSPFADPFFRSRILFPVTLVRGGWSPQPRVTFRHSARIPRHDIYVEFVLNDLYVDLSRTHVDEGTQTRLARQKRQSLPGLPAAGKLVCGGVARSTVRTAPRMLTPRQLLRVPTCQGLGFRV